MNEKEISSNLNWYKYCFVPGCKNTTAKTPSKIFSTVPSNPLKRKRWCEAVGCPEKKIMKVSYCCEDHFDLQNDLQNYREWKIMGCRKMMKPDVVPRFCLPVMQDSTSAQEILSTLPRNALDYSNISTSRESSNSISWSFSESRIDRSGSEVEPELIATLSSVTMEPKHNKFSQCSIEVEHKHVQVNPKVHTKNVQTKKILLKDASVNCNLSRPHHVLSSTDQCYDIPPKSKSTDMSTSVSDGGSLYNPSVATTDSNNERESQVLLMKENIFIKCTKLLIESNSLLFLGIRADCMFIINVLQEASSLDIRDIYLVLKKIRTNLSFAILASEFGLSASQTSRILKKSIHIVAQYFRELIVWPDNYEISANLPKQFRYRYFDVHNIIDCFEIEIEKLSNAVHQALTWSDYKKCSTAKFLIAISPDGLIIFMSRGVGGRCTDMSLVENSGYLNYLPENKKILADRGFKNIDTAVAKKKCILVRPPSVQQNEKLTKNNSILTKKIASLRIHVERVINRIRHFQLLNIHTRVDINLLDCLDSAVIIAAGLVNLQSPEIKQFDM